MYDDVPGPYRLPDKPFLFYYNPPTVREHMIYVHFQFFNQYKAFQKLSSTIMHKRCDILDTVYERVYFYYISSLSNSYNVSFLDPADFTCYSTLDTRLAVLHQCLDSLYYYARIIRLHALLHAMLNTVHKLRSGCQFIIENLPAWDRHQSEEEFNLTHVVPFQVDAEHPAHVNPQDFIIAWFFNGFVHGYKMDWDQYKKLCPLTNLMKFMI